jgi:exodeoxyribonuclease VII large subunit
MLITLSYKSVLGRGYALVRDAEGRAVRSVGQVVVGNGIDIEVGDGRIAANVTTINAGLDTNTSPSTTKMQPAPKQRASASKLTKSSSGGPQGSLF